MNVLFVGNSFAVDTTEYAPDVARSLGISSFFFGTLYIGGCSIQRHYQNVTENVSAYRYYTNDGTGWNVTPDYSIQQAACEREWDYICIQHGTKDGSRYTSVESYVRLMPLIRKIREYVGSKPKFAFNMAWVAEPEGTHPEILSYHGDQKAMYQNLVKLTKELIFSEKEVDVVIPTGTAVQNARQKIEKKLTRDDFHLSYDLGRYLASLTLLSTLLGLKGEKPSWRPDGVTEQEAEIAWQAVLSAVRSPFCVTL